MAYLESQISKDMLPVKISLLKLGNLKYPVYLSQIERWKSDLISISSIKEIAVLPNAEGENWEYTDKQLSTLISHNNDGDITVAITNVPLENNFFLRRLSNNVCVLSLYEIAEILNFSGLSTEKFIIKVLYEIITVYLENQQKIPVSAYTIAHDETRGCIFDMCASKYDIIHSSSNPTICSSCKTRLSSKQMEKHFISKLENELQRIKRPLFYKISDFIKQHPVWSLVITALSGLVLNIFANVIYDCWIKKLFTE
ncbi:MAG: hypothetical protein AB1400_04605 [Pseudomonadota bacterium]